MAAKKSAVPKLHFHKGTGQGRVRVQGKDYYLGAYGSPECMRRYGELVQNHAAGEALDELPKCRDADKGILIAELVGLYAAKRVKARYVDGEGKYTTEGDLIRDALKELRLAMGTMPAAEFGPLALQDLRALMVARKLARSTVNGRIGRIRRMFKWAQSQQLVPRGHFEDLATVENLRDGEDGVKSTEPIRPVEKAHVDATLPYLSRQLNTVVKLQSLTAARGGEILTMRPCDIDQTHEVWWYRPETHKNKHRGKDRLIPLGRQAQELVKPFLDRHPESYLFSPFEARKERYARMRADRIERHAEKHPAGKNPIQPSQVDRSVDDPKWKPADRYSPGTYRKSIWRAVNAANAQRAKEGLPPIPQWHPHQLRHAAATAIRKSHGLETASIMLGHSSVSMTELYAEKNRDLAATVAAEIG